MFTVNIKGKQNPKNENLVKLELIFFKTGYARVTKAANPTFQVQRDGKCSDRFSDHTRTMNRGYTL